VWDQLFGCKPKAKTLRRTKAKGLVVGLCWTFSESVKEKREEGGRTATRGHCFVVKASGGTSPLPC
jgi:hypothetical protein